MIIARRDQWVQRLTTNKIAEDSYLGHIEQFDHGSHGFTRIRRIGVIRVIREIRGQMPGVGSVLLLSLEIGAKSYFSGGQGRGGRARVKSLTVSVRLGL